MLQSIVLLGAIIIFFEITWFIAMFIVSLLLGVRPISNSVSVILKIVKTLLLVWLLHARLVQLEINIHSVLFIVALVILFLHLYLKPVNSNFTIRIPNKVWIIGNNNHSNYALLIAITGIVVLFSIQYSLYPWMPVYTLSGFSGFISKMSGIIFYLGLFMRISNMKNATRDKAIVEK